MYTDDELKVNTNSKYAKLNMAYIESMINDYDKKNDKSSNKDEHTTRYAEEALSVVESTRNRKNIESRYHSFSETVRTTLMTEALLDMFKRSVPNRISKNYGSAMRCIINDYVNESGYGDILRRMKKASIPMANLANIVESCTNSILESVDKDNPDTFKIPDSKSSEFFKKIADNDEQEITDAISSRVSDAIQDFIDSNSKEHEDITNALKNAEEKIKDNSTTDNTSNGVNEYYQMKTKNDISNIRSSEKSIFDIMVTSFCEDAMSDKESFSQFFSKDDHIDIGKAVDFTSVSYSFMEMLNTSKIDKIDSVFIEGVLNEIADKKKNGKYDFDKLFQEFKDKELKNAGKDPKSFGQKLEKLAAKLYSPSVNGIIEGTPKFLYFLKTVAVGAGVSFFIPLGPIINSTMLSDYLAFFNKSEIRKMQKCFEKEIEKSEAELKKMKDRDKIKEMTEYIKILKDGLEKIKRY